LPLPGKRKRPAPRGVRQRHHPLAPSLAAHKDRRRIAAHGGKRQGHEFAHPQPRGIEEFEQAERLHPSRPRPDPLSRGDEGEHLGLRQGLGQTRGPARPPESQRRIVGPPALGMGEAEQRAHRGKPARPRRPRQPARIAFDQIAFHIGLRCGAEVAAPLGQE
jgi:hypothetical protein